MFFWRPDAGKDAMSAQAVDVIDEILGENNTDRVVMLRSQKPELASQRQAYYDAVFEPAPDSAEAFSVADRFLVAVRTASHTGSAAVVDWYSGRARESGVEGPAIDRARNVAEPWPDEDRLGPVMRHVDLITARPVESSKRDIDALLESGLTPGAVVVLSQVVAYVSYQLRLIAALRALGESR